MENTQLPLLVNLVSPSRHHMLPSRGWSKIFYWLLANDGGGGGGSSSGVSGEGDHFGAGQLDIVCSPLPNHLSSNLCILLY